MDLDHLVDIWTDLDLDWVINWYSSRYECPLQIGQSVGKTSSGVRVMCQTSIVKVHLAEDACRGDNLKHGNLVDINFVLYR